MTRITLSYQTAIHTAMGQMGQEMQITFLPACWRWIKAVVAAKA